MLKRKFLAAFIGSAVVALVFFLFDEPSIEGFFTLYFLNLMFAITYGVAMSWISDFVSKEVIKHPVWREVAAFVLHAGFGLLMTTLGFISAIVFYIVDRCLQRVRIHWMMFIVALLFTVTPYVYYVFIAA